MTRRKRKKQKSKLKLLLLGAAGSVLLIGVILFFVAGRYLTPNYITSKVEEDLNCRFELGSIDIALFSPSVALTLKDVKIAERDAFVKDKTPHDERPKLQQSVIEVGTVVVKISLLDILLRNLSVQSVLIDDAHANVVLHRDGTHSLEKLLANPQIKKRSKKDKGETFNIVTNSSLVAKLKKFNISNTSLDLVVEASELNVRATDINLELVDELALDVKDLKKMESSSWLVGVDINLFSGDGKIEYGKLELSGDFFGTIFNVETGDLDPILELKLGLGSGSYLKQIPVLEKVSDAYLGMKKLPFINKSGLKKWPGTYPFKDDKEIHCSFKKNRYEFISPLAIDVGQWKLQLDPGAWFNTTDVNHEFNFSLYAGSTVSKIIDGGYEILVKALPKSIKKKAMEEVEKLAYDNGQFVLKFKTMEKLTSPKIKVTSKLPDIKNIKDMLFDDLGSSFKDLLGR